MKKHIIIALIAATTLSANAQDKLLRWGPKVGTNLSTLSNTRYNAKSEYRVGVTAGFIVEFKPTNWVSASAEILYSNTGTKLGQAENRFASARYDMHYLDIPLMANFYICKGLALSTGVQISPLLGANIITKNKKGNRQQENCRSDFRSTALSIPVAINYNFDFGLFIDARYNFGLTNISNTYTTGGVNTRELKIKSSNFVVSVGWKF